VNWSVSPDNSIDIYRYLDTIFVDKRLDPLLKAEGPEPFSFGKTIIRR